MPAIPGELADLLTSDAIGHISFVAPDGSIRSVIVWIDFDGEHEPASVVASRGCLETVTWLQYLSAQ